MTEKIEKTSGELTSFQLYLKASEERGALQIRVDELKKIIDKALQALRRGAFEEAKRKLLTSVAEDGSLKG